MLYLKSKLHNSRFYWLIICDPFSRCHLISFAFSFAYLLFFRITEHFGIPYPPTHTNLIQMMLTLKLVGLAFEINSSYQYKKKSDADKTAEEKLDDINPGLIDIFHYSFNYIGVLTGNIGMFLLQCTL